MVSKKFFTIIVIRIIAIFLTCLWLAYTIPSSQKIYTYIVIVILLLLQVYALIYHVNKTNRAMAGFFVSLRDEYSFYRFSEDKDISASSSSLSQVLNETSDLLRKARVEKEKQFRFMEFVFENAGSGMIIFLEDGKINRINNLAIMILECGNVRNIHELDRISRLLTQKLMLIRPGDSEVIRFVSGNAYKIIRIGISVFRVEGVEYKLANVQDVRNEMEEYEIESMQKLIRVINHEIMNSITPIITITEAIKRGWLPQGQVIAANEINENFVHDTIDNIGLIERRSNGLKSFVENYRKFSQITRLNIQTFSVKQMVRESLMLFANEMLQKGIDGKISIDPDGLSLDGDRKLLEQVMINLIKNAVEAVDSVEYPKIRITAGLDDEKRVTIKISDNGCGIPEEQIHEIFIPFFTTKESGAGIGLSLSRHIMRLHKGSISVMRNEPGSVFSLRF
nr:GHKL domain-containing protein [Bacteroidota bacterium]